MRLSKDIIVSDFDDDRCKIYNKFTHHLTLLHKLVYKYMLDSDGANNFSNIHNDLSHEQISTLVENGVLIEDENTYLSKRFVRTKTVVEKQINTAYLHLTFNCNLRCDYCYARDNISLAKADLTTEQWVRILKELKLVDVERIVFTGGEPTLHKGLSAISEYAKSLNFHATLLTNGTFLNDIECIFSNLNEVVVSLDGISASKRKGLDQNLLIKNIIALSKEHQAKLSVRSVIVKGFEDEVLRLKENLEEHNIPHSTSLCLPCNREEIKDIPDYDRYDLIQNGLLDGCGAATSIIAIDPRGGVFPCQTLVKPEFLITNILNNGWYSEFKTNSLNEEITKFNPYENDYCISCEALHFCNGGCPSIINDVYETFDARPDFFCDYYRKCAIKKIKGQ